MITDRRKKALEKKKKQRKILEKLNSTEILLLEILKK
jgi:hypothetical protein